MTHKFQYKTVEHDYEDFNLIEQCTKCGLQKEQKLSVKIVKNGNKFESEIQPDEDRDPSYSTSLVQCIYEENTHTCAEILEIDEKEKNRKREPIDYAKFSKAVKEIYSPENIEKLQLTRPLFTITGTK